MALARRFLPSTTLLQAFEAASRLESFTAAAAELHLTQSAVSRQIRALEEQLGSAMFVRERQTIRLTDAGRSYSREIRSALEAIASATLRFRANPQGGTLNLAILPTFGTRWLAPRLPDFIARNPGVTLNLTTRLGTFDFANDAMDAAIHFGKPDWPGADAQFLMREILVPACSPALRSRFALEMPADLLRAPLLHLASRPDAWETWFRRNAVEHAPISGMLFDQFATATQAAISGMGIALLPQFLFQTELDRGDLVMAVDRPMENDDAYYLAWPTERGDSPPLLAFRHWMAEVTGQNG
jgi:LysR family transcriptional regulator, glycine cleavage system transcriptional activator